MIDPQRSANEIRDRLAEHSAIERLGIEVLRAVAGPDGLTVRARRRDHVVTVQRGGAWTLRPLEELASELAHELVAEALGTRRTEPWLRWQPAARPRARRRPAI